MSTAGQGGLLPRAFPRTDAGFPLRGNGAKYIYITLYCAFDDNQNNAISVEVQISIL